MVKLTSMQLLLSKTKNNLLVLALMSLEPNLMNKKLDKKFEIPINFNFD